MTVRRTLFAGLLAGALALTTCGAQASKPRAPVELYHMLLQAQNSSKDADAKMFQSMLAARDSVVRYRRTHNGFPESAVEVEEFTRLLNSRPTKNPYFESEMLAQQMSAQDPHQIQYQISTDYGMSKQSMDSKAKQPPKSWRAAPGTISIIHNSENSFAIWAAGLDCTPVTNGTTGSAELLFCDLSAP